MNNVKLFSRIIIWVCFLSLLLNHVIGFDIKFYKYSSSYLISEYELQWGYYFMIFFEMLSLIVLLFNSDAFIYKVYDYLFIFYIIFVLVCLINFNKITNGCIECHYIASVFFAGYKLTIFLLVAVTILYFLVLRGNIKQKQFKN